MAHQLSEAEAGLVLAGNVSGLLDAAAARATAGQGPLAARLAIAAAHAAPGDQPQALAAGSLARALAAQMQQWCRHPGPDPVRGLPALQLLTKALSVLAAANADSLTEGGFVKQVSALLSRPPALVGPEPLEFAMRALTEVASRNSQAVSEISTDSRLFLHLKNVILVCANSKDDEAWRNVAHWVATFTLVACDRNIQAIPPLLLPSGLLEVLTRSIVEIGSSAVILPTCRCLAVLAEQNRDCRIYLGSLLGPLLAEAMAPFAAAVREGSGAEVCEWGLRLMVAVAADGPMVANRLSFDAGFVSRALREYSPISPAVAEWASRALIVLTSGSPTASARLTDAGAAAAIVAGLQASIGHSRRSAVEWLLSAAFSLCQGNHSCVEFLAKSANKSVIETAVGECSGFAVGTDLVQLVRAAANS